MCEVPKDTVSRIKKFSEDDRLRLGRMLFKKALQVVIGCGYEPTMHKQFMHYVSMANDYGVPYVGITSNGQLLTKQHIEQFIQYGLSEITISLHGVQKKTYQRLMINASYENLHKFLENLDAQKAKHNIKTPSLRINYTINSDNIDELPMFFNCFGHYGIDTLQIRPMYGDCYPEGKLSERDTQKYAGYLKAISTECSKKNITLMAHTGDLNFNQDNSAAIIYPEIFYHIDPNIVWRQDFAWRDETYNSYCRRIKYNKYLIKSVLSGKKTLLKRADLFPGSGRYDVF
jgi:MoaA/NifB/PqqE/SkfB family radical SAM enzyme